MNRFKIGNKTIGQNSPLYFIADIAANHDGNLQRAYELIELAKESGADAAKFQNFKAEKIVSKHGFESMGKQLSHQASWKKPVFEVYKDASVPSDWTEKLKRKCDSVGIEYMTSPYDFQSVDAVDQYVNAYKVGSGDITWLEILEHMSRKGKPMILASGASTMSDVEKAMSIIMKHTKDIVLMQCNTNYTASKENLKYINLNVLTTYTQRYPDAVLGLSDHTHGHATVLGALALGARVFEKHFTDDNHREGPDHAFAMNPQSFKEMVGMSSDLYCALGDGKKKIEDNERDSAVVQRRSIRYVKDLKKGHVITPADIFPLRPAPADSILPNEIDSVIGRTLAHETKEDDYVRHGDLV
jgi:sialic acid synthase SpsE